MEAIPHSERAKDIKDLDLSFDDLPIERALGIQRCVESDSFKFRLQLKEQSMTRRGILSTVASVYDPLGLLAPFVLTGKQILQEMRKQGAGWDDPLSDELQSRWERWREDLPGLASVKISRYRPENFGKVVKYELHHFSDASSTEMKWRTKMTAARGKCMLTATPAMIFWVFEPKESEETASNFDRLQQPSDRSLEADLFESNSDSPESDSTVVYTLPSSLNDDVDVLDDDDYTPRRRKLPRHNPSGRGTRGGAPREAHGFLPGPMAMPAAADAVGLDEDGEGVDTVMVVVTLTEDRPSSLLFRTELKCCGNETTVCNLTGCRTWQAPLASLPLKPLISGLWTIFNAHSRLSSSRVCALRLTGTMLSGHRIRMRMSR